VCVLKAKGLLLCRGLIRRFFSPGFAGQAKLTMLAQLIPKQGGAPITLTRAITVVGRSSKLCDLVVEHTNVSKQHCILVKTDGLIYLRDLGSTNGTRVNGQRVIRGALLPGDQLSLSGVSFKIHLGPDKPVAGKVSAIQMTEMVPLLDDDGLNSGASDATSRADDASKSDVRFLRDSDLLMPD
jgi:predicted component of type VI protein secretion system